MDEYKDFSEVFGVEFGKRGKYKEYFGERGQLPDNPTDVCFSFTAPLNLETDVSFAGGDSLQFMEGILVIGTQPNPTIDSPGVVGYRIYEHNKGAGRLSMFVNDTAEDPKPLYDYYTQTYTPRDTWLKPGWKYYCRFYRTKVNPDGMPPFRLTYAGLTKNDDKTPLASIPQPVGTEPRIIIYEGVEGWFTPI